MAHRRPYTPDERATIIAAYNDARERGLPADKAAAEAGATWATIRSWTRPSSTRGVKRPCLGCGEPMVSEHIGHRLCDVCRRGCSSLPAQFL